MELKKVTYLLRSLNLKNKDKYFSKAARNITKGLKPILFRLSKKEFDPKDAFVVFSEARGGSTWIMQILQESLNGITLFEPLHTTKSEMKKVADNYNYCYPFYFADQDAEKALIKYLTKLFAGKISGERILQFNTFRDIYSGDSLVVKFVNVNLIAPWFAETFELRYKPIYLLRHPLAILASREHYGLFGKKPEGNKQLGAFNRKRLEGDFHPYHAYLDELDRADNKYSRYITGWCIRNKDFLNGTYNDDFHLIFYEDMVLQPEQVLEDLSNTWNIDLKDSNPRNESGTTDVGGKVYDGQKQLSKWRQFFSEEEKRMMQLVLDRFDVKLYSAFSPNILRDESTHTGMNSSMGT